MNKKLDIGFIIGIIVMILLIASTVFLVFKKDSKTVSIEEYNIVVEYIQAKEMYEHLQKQHSNLYPGLEEGFEIYLIKHYNDFYTDFLLKEKKYKALEIPKYPLGITGGNKNESYI